MLGKLGPAGIVAGAGLLAAGAAVSAIAVSSIDAASKFDDAVVHLQNQAGITKDAADKVGSAMLDMGSKGLHGADALMAALAPVAGQLETLTGHALTTSDAEQLMAHAGDLATASHTDLGTATSTLTSIMLAYKIPLKDAAVASDELYNISRATGVGLGELGTAAGRLHARLGVAAPSLTDIGALMVDLQAQGITGSRGILAVSSGMTMLLSGAKPVQAELAKLGVSVFDSSGKFIGMSETIKRLSPALAKLTDEQRAAAEKALFGASAGGMLDGVLRQGVSTFDAYRQRVQETGTAHKAAAAEAETLSGMITIMKNHVHTLMIELGQHLEPVVRSVFGWLGEHGPQAIAEVKSMIADAMPVFRAMGDVWQSLQPALEKVAGIIRDTLLPPLRALGSFVAEHKEIIESLGAAFLIVATALGVYALATVGATAATAAFGVVLAIATSPVTLIVLALAALILIIIEAVKHWDQIKAAMERVVNYVKDEVLTVFDTLKHVWEEHKVLVTALAAVLLAPLLPFIALGVAIYELVNHFGALKSGVMGAVAAVRNVIVSGFGAIATFINQHFSGIEEIVKGAWLVIKSYVQIGIDLVRGIVKVVMDLIHGDFGKAWRDIEHTVHNVLDDIGNMILGLLMIAVGEVKTAVQAIHYAFTDGFDAVKRAAEAGIDAVLGFFRALPGRVVSALSALPGMLLDAGKAALHGLWQGANSGYSILKAFFETLPSEIISWLGDAGTMLYDIGKKVVDGFINGIKSMAGDVAGAVKDMAGSAVHGALGALGIGSPSRVFHEIGLNVGQGLVNGMTASTGMVTGAASAMAASAVAAGSGSIPALTTGVGAPPGMGTTGMGAAAATSGLHHLHTATHAATTSAHHLSAAHHTLTTHAHHLSAAHHTLTTHAHHTAQAMQALTASAVTAAAKLAGVQSIDAKGVMKMGPQDDAKLQALMQKMGDSGMSLSDFSNIVKMSAGSFGVSAKALHGSFDQLEKVAEQFGVHLVHIGDNIMAAEKVQLSAEQQAMVAGLQAIGEAKSVAIQEVFQTGSLNAQLASHQITSLQYLQSLPKTEQDNMVRLLNHMQETGQIPKAHTGAFVKQGGMAELSTGETVLPPASASGVPGSGTQVVIDVHDNEFVDAQSLDRLIERLGYELTTRVLPGAGVQITRR